MKLKKPDPHILTVWRLRLIPVAVFLLYLSLQWILLPFLLWWIFTVLWICVLLFLLLVYYPLKYRRLSYQVTSRMVVVYSGVLTVHIKAVPFPAVQYTSLLSTPLLRQFGLCSVLFYMAGSRLLLSGLSCSDAEALHTTLRSFTCDGGGSNE